MAWRPVGEPWTQEPGDFDGRSWLWEVIDEDKTTTKSVIVRATDEAMGRHQHDREHPLHAALNTLGRSEIERVLGWIEPPDTIELVAGSTEPVYAGGKQGS